MRFAQQEHQGTGLSNAAANRERQLVLDDSLMTGESEVVGKVRHLGLLAECFRISKAVSSGLSAGFGRSPLNSPDQRFGQAAVERQRLYWTGAARTATVLAITPGCMPGDRGLSVAHFCLPARVKACVRLKVLG